MIMHSIVPVYVSNNFMRTCASVGPLVFLDIKSSDNESKMQDGVLPFFSCVFSVSNIHVQMYITIFKAVLL